MMYKTRNFLSNRAFQIVILAGLLLLLWRPTIQLGSAVSSLTGKVTGTEDWTKDIVISNPVGKQNTITAYKDDTPMNTESMSSQPTKNVIVGENQNQITVVLERVPQLENSQEILENNKRLIINEVVRRNQNLAWWSHFDFERDPNVPSLDYVLEVLENRLGAEYLYSDIEDGVTLILEYVDNAKGSEN